MQEIKEFLKSIHPFDILDDEDLNFLAKNTDVGYYRENSEIIKPKELPKAFYIVLKGSIKEINSDNEVIDFYNEKDFFDLKSLLNSAKNSFIATTDTITYEIEKSAFLEIFNKNREFKNFFLLDISQKIEKLKELKNISELGEFLSVKIEDIIINPPLIVDGKTSIYDVVKMMEEKKVQIAIVKKSDSNYIFGVFTDKDLRKAVLKRLNYGQKIEDIANFPAVAIEKNEFLFNALLKMTSKNIKHLVITENEKIIGTLEITDILSYFSNQSYIIIKNIESSKNIEELKSVSNSFINVAKVMFHKGIKIRYLSKLMDELHTRLYKKVFALSFDTDTIKNSNLIALGSEGRGEQTIRTDQDNALIVDDIYWEKNKDNILKKAQKFTENLLYLGYPKCPGNIMVSNPYWCKGYKEFKETVLDWITNPTEEKLIYISVFLDAKAINENSKNLENLKELIYDRVSDNFSFLSHLAKPILSFETPINFFNMLLADKKNRVDLKKGGIFPIVHGARVLSLQFKIEKTNTVERIKEISNLNIIDKNFATNLIEAYDSLQNFRLKNALESNSSNINETNLDKLSKIEKDLLKDSFKIVEEFKKFIKYHFRLDMVT